MIIVLTGATGFVGRAVVAEALAQGHGVRALVRDQARAALPDAVGLVQGDLGDGPALSRLAAGADAVIHAAGAISARSPADFFAVNEAGSVAVAQAAAAQTVGRFVQVSSLSARAPGLSTYGASKRAGEEGVSRISGLSSLAIIRPPAVYGPGDRATLPLLKALTQSPAVIPGRRAARFSLILVTDLARILVAAATSARTGLVEIDDGKAGGYDWFELAQLASQSEGRTISPLFLPYGLAASIAGIAEFAALAAGRAPILSRDKMRELYHPDWVAQGEGWPLPGITGFAQGFARTVQWYRDAKWLPARRGLTMNKPKSV
jgi:nucleoside-diphosphate-sugar epimerase